MVRPVGTGIYKADKKQKVKEGEYETSHPEKLLEMMENGKLDCEIYAAFKVSRKTFYLWIREHDDFGDAHEIGLPACEAWWVQWGMKGMQGEIKGFNFNSWIAFMNNKFKWAKMAGGGEGTTNNITVNQMNVLSSKPRADLIDFIKAVGNKNTEVLNAKFIESDTSDGSGSGDDANYRLITNESERTGENS